MPWLKLLHIAALLAWSGILLYLPAAIAASSLRSGRAEGASDPEFFRAHQDSLVRVVFTLVATPAALLAIVSGVAVLLVELTFGLWLILKLTAVAALVLCHAACGVLILRVERDRRSALGFPCAAVGMLSTLVIVTIFWLVLAKPY